MADFVDTSVFIRHLAGDHDTQSPAATRYFSEVEAGAHEAWATMLVVSEIEYVMTSKSLYAVTRRELARNLLPLLQLPSLRIEGSHLLPRVFEFYLRSSIDFVDAYHAALMEARAQTDVVSFDRHFDRIPGLRRREP